MFSWLFFVCLSLGFFASFFFFFFLLFFPGVVGGRLYSFVCVSMLLFCCSLFCLLLLGVGGIIAVSSVKKRGEGLLAGQNISQISART